MDFKILKETKEKNGMIKLDYEFSYNKEEAGVIKKAYNKKRITDKLINQFVYDAIMFQVKQYEKN